MMLSIFSTLLLVARAYILAPAINIEINPKDSWVLAACHDTDIGCVSGHSGAYLVSAGFVASSHTRYDRTIACTDSRIECRRKCALMQHCVGITPAFNSSSDILAVEEVSLLVSDTVLSAMPGGLFVPVTLSEIRCGFSITPCETSEVVVQVPDLLLGTDKVSITVHKLAGASIDVQTSATLLRGTATPFIESKQYESSTFTVTLAARSPYSVCTVPSFEISSVNRTNSTVTGHIVILIVFSVVLLCYTLRHNIYNLYTIFLKRKKK